jgi:site-specific DNA-methyltransferase (adenine-specific)
VENDWEYRCCHLWNKGKGHVAGNANTKTLRKFPVVTEVCVQYVRKVRLPLNGKELPLKSWLRAEWLRSGLTLTETNRACGVANAATRKYFTKCHLWYFPPAEHFASLVEYANRHGSPEGRPYFSIDGRKPLTAVEWGRMRAKFYCEYGINNVWTEPPMRGTERLKNGSRCVHLNQKPLKLTEMIIRVSSDPGDVVWEPFGGLCSAAVASHNLDRKCFSAEILPEYYDVACRRLASNDGNKDAATSTTRRPGTDPYTSSRAASRRVRRTRKKSPQSGVGTLPFV